MKRIMLIAMIVVVMAAVSVVPAVAQGAPGRWNTSVYDRGARAHAMGTVWGNLYYVVRGDTLFSIGLRFGLYWPVIAAGERYQQPTQHAGRTMPDHPWSGRDAATASASPDPAATSSAHALAAPTHADADPTADTDPARNVGHPHR